MKRQSLSIAALADGGWEPGVMLRRWARVPRLLVLAITPLLVFAGSLVVLFTLWAVLSSNELEAVLMGLLWIGATAASGGLGLRSACGERRPRPWLVALAVTVAISPLAVTPVLGPSAGAALLVLGSWGAALIVLAAAAERLSGGVGTRPGGAFAVAAGTVLVFLAAFLAARLNLPAEQAALASAPWWLPVAVTDHALAPDVANRLDATRVAFGVSVLFAYATAFVLSYAVGASHAPAQPRTPFALGGAAGDLVPGNAGHSQAQDPSPTHQARTGVRRAGP